MSMIAIPWYFAQKEMLSYFGVVYIITNIIVLFWSPISGSIVDKYDRKKIFLTLTIVVGSVIGAISFLGYSLGELPPLIVASVFMITFLNYNVHYPCLYAFVQEITEGKYYSKISSLLEIVGQFTTIVAGAVATLLLEGTANGFLSIFGQNIYLGFNIEAWKIHEIFLLDSSTYFVGFLIILFIKYKPILERKVETGNLITRLKVGISYLKDNKSILWFGVLSYTVFLALLLEAFYLGVSYVSNHLQESGDVYSNSKMAYALGAICVGFTLRFVFKYMNIPKAVIIMTFLMGLIYMTLALTQSLFIFFSMMFLVGIMNAGTRIARMTYLFKNVPNQFFGRVGSVLFFTNVILRVLLLMLFTLPFFQVGNNIIYAFIIVSSILFIATLLMIKHYNTFDLSLSKE